VRIKTVSIGALVLSLLVPAGAAARDRPVEPAERAVGVSFDLDAGARMLRLSTLQVDRQGGTASFVPRTSWGPTVGASAALRLLAFTIGGSTSVSFFDHDRGERTDEDNLWNLDLDLGVRLPLRRVEPYFSAGVGYSRAAGLDDALAQGGGERTVDGWNGHATLGANAVLGEHFVLGLRVEGHLMALTRGDVSLSDAVHADDVSTAEDAAREIDEAEGTSVGGALGLLVDGGWRI